MARAGMAAKQPADEQVPAVAGAAPHESLDYLPRGTGLPWLDEARERHRAAVIEWRKAHRAVEVIAEQTEQLERDHRRRVRDALVAGEPAPARDFDPDSRNAAREVAVEEAEQARTELARVSTDALILCRQHRDELQAYSDRLSESLLRSLADGPSAATQRLRDQLRERLARIDREPGDTAEPIPDVATLDPLVEDVVTTNDVEAVHA